MLIGVYIPETLHSSGGAHSFINRTIEAIREWENSQTEIKIVFFSSHTLHFSNSKDISSCKVISIPRNRSVVKKFKAKLRELLEIETFKFNFNREFEAFDLDFLWCLGPVDFIPTIPFGVTIWDVEHRRTPYFPEFLNGQWEYRELNNQALLRRAALVITGTEFTAQLIEKFYGVESSRICISPFPVPSSKDVKSNSKSDKVFLYPAQFWPHKNHLNLIQGFAKALNASGEKLKLILPGSDNGMLEKCKNEVARLGVIDFVFFPGFVSDEELRKYFQECRNIIYPSLFGPDNLPPLEGLSACCNVYVAEIPGAREVYGENVKYFDPLSSDSISEVFLEASNHSDEFLDVSHKRSSMLVTPSYSVGQVFRSIKLLEPYIRTWKPNN